MIVLLPTVARRFDCYSFLFLNYDVCHLIHTVPHHTQMLSAKYSETKKCYIIFSKSATERISVKYVNDEYEFVFRL